MNANTMPLEPETRVLIDRNLENLGWKLTGEDQNVFFEQPKTETERKKLGGKRPDYVLYSKESDKPLIVIEAKKKGSRTDTALEQGISYARAIEAPLVFATDGVFCRAFHTGANRPPILNGEEVDEFIREALALRYLTSYEVNTVSPKVQYDRKELIRIFDEANNMLRGEGLRAGIERFGEFANILFLKLISESEQIKKENGCKTKFDRACSWDCIKQIPPTARIEYINKTVYEKLNKLYGTDIFTALQLRDPSILSDIMGKLDPLMLTDVDSDVKGDAFEYFLKASTSTKNDLGEYFTPRHIVKTMVRLVNPQIGEKIYDPFCGTGGFLIESFRYIYSNMARTEANLTLLREHTVYGNEITNTARITKMNMILAGDGHSNIKMKDSLANPEDGTKTYYDEKGNNHHCGFDIVLANMPYSQQTKHGNLYDLPSTNGDSICVQHCMKAINSASSNGRMALVVPEGFLFRKDLTKTREYLLNRCQLESIISLPQGVFLPYTGVKTNIIYATKVNQKVKPSEGRKDFWYFDVKSDGYTLDNNRRKLDTPSDLSKYEEYRKLDDNQADDMLKVGFEKIPLDTVRKNSNILVGSRYRTNTVVTSKAGWPLVKVGDLFDVVSDTINPIDEEGRVVYVGLENIEPSTGQLLGLLECEISSIRSTKRVFKNTDILFGRLRPVLNKVAYPKKDGICSTDIIVLRTKNSDSLFPELYVRILRSKHFNEMVLNGVSGGQLPRVDSKYLLQLPIQKIPLEVQRKIVAELDDYQQIIKGAQTVINTYRPHLPKYEKAFTVALGDSHIFDIQSGGTPDSNNPQYWNGEINWITLTDLPKDDHVTEINSSLRKITRAGLDNSSAKLLPVNTVVVSTRATIGRIGIARVPLATNQGFKNVIVNNTSIILPEFLALILREKGSEMERLSSGATFKEISKVNFGTIKIDIPSLEEQRKILDGIRREQALIEPSKEIVKVFTAKIDTRIKEIWNE